MKRLIIKLNPRGWMEDGDENSYLKRKFINYRIPSLLKTLALPVMILKSKDRQKRKQ